MRARHDDTPSNADDRLNSGGAGVGAGGDATLTIEEMNCVRQLLRRNQRNANLLASLETSVFDAGAVPVDANTEPTASSLAGILSAMSTSQGRPGGRRMAPMPQEAEIDPATLPENNDETLPKHYLCPITHMCMREPVVAADGHTYERAAIERWLHTSTRSPMTGEEVTSMRLLPNYTVKSLICDHITRMRPVYDSGDHRPGGPDDAGSPRERAVT